jgi:hypothetical protein
VETPPHPLEVVPVPFAGDQQRTRGRQLTTLASFLLSVWLAHRSYHSWSVALGLAVIFAAATYVPFWLAWTMFGRGAVYWSREWSTNRAPGSLLGIFLYGALSAACWVLLGVTLYLLSRWAPGAR